MESYLNENVEFRMVVGSQLVFRFIFTTLDMKNI